jgi:hypothetical protein
VRHTEVRHTEVRRNSDRGKNQGGNHFLLLASRHACLTSKDMSGENSAIAQSIFLTSIIDGYIQKQMAKTHKTPMTITVVITNSVNKFIALSMSASEQLL